MRPGISGLFKRLAAGGGILLISAALLLGLLRVLEPQLIGHRARIELLASEALGMPVKIGRLDARWRLAGPELVFHDATVLAADGSSPVAHADSGSVSVQLWRLIARRELNLRRLVLEGARVSVERTDAGFGLVGKVRSGELPALPTGIFELRGSQIDYYDGSRGPWRFTAVDARIRNDGDGPRATGELELPAALGGSLRFSAHRLGVPAGAHSQLMLDVDAEHLELQGWSDLLPKSWPVPAAGHGQASLQALWSGPRLDRMTVDAVLSGVRPPPGSEVTYDRLAGQFRWVRQPNGWMATAREVELRRGPSIWPTSELALRVSRASPSATPAVRTEASYLRIEDLLPLIHALPDDEYLTRLDAFDPRGVLRKFEAGFARNGTEFSVTADVEDGAVEAVGRLPAVSGVDGHVEASDAGGRVTLDSGDLELEWRSLFAEPVHLDAASGAVIWRRGRDAWRVISDGVLLRNAHFATRSSFEVGVPFDSESLVIDLETDVQRGDLAHLGTYLPANVLSPKVRLWLQRGVQSGRVKSGHVSIAGPLEAFPFADGEGRLQARFDIEDATLDYAAEWPIAESLDGRLEFDGAALRARVHDGHLLGNRIVRADARFADLRSGVLKLDGRTVGALSDAQAFLNRSPLKSSLGALAERLEVGGGDSRVDVELELPLRHIADRQVRAALTVADGIIGLQGLAPRFERTAGTLHLADGELSGDGIAALLFGRPVDIEVLPDGQATMMTVSGSTSPHDVPEKLAGPLASRLDGEAAWLATARFPAADVADDASATVDIESDLEGLEVRLPAPFTKPRREAVPFAVEIEFPQPGRLRIEGRWSAIARARVELQRAETGWALAAGAARFGPGELVLPEHGGLTVEGSLPELRLEEWLALRSSGEGGKIGFRSADPTLDKLYAFGRRVPGPVQLDVARNTQEWLIGIESPQVAGAIFMPLDTGGPDPLVLRMDRLLLIEPDPEGGPGRGLQDPTLLPAMDLAIGEFALGERRLGAVQATIERVPAGLRMTSLEAAGPTFRAVGTGAWLGPNDDPQTHVQLELESSDVGETLGALGFGEGIEAESGAATFELSWPGSPIGPILARLDGTASVRLDDGQLSNVEPGAGRVFGLLSVAALPRRLSLDFRDVFIRGLAFDKVAGDFTIEDGNAYTSNLLLEGPAADVGIIGRAGLASRDYDQTAIVSASVGKSLPIAAYLAGGPQFAAAMLLFSQIFKKPLKGMTQVYYHVGGSWDDPLVERIEPVQETDAPRADVDDRAAEG
ncbi:YhdP family protein [soil metagenome]